ncbi:MAG TPA: rRNA maturation RNase YbeY [Lacipirellulaceae bacterium]|nr:rRNA maturation RNase YbeY [Lacipirellulaceae bacterium]
MPPAHSRLEDAPKRSDQNAAATGLRVDVVNETEHAYDVARLAAAVQCVLSDAAVASDAISGGIVGDPASHRLKRQFLQPHYPTDVLGLLLSPSPCLEGEIIASADTAAREAASVGWTAADELLLYVVHGALHLVGHRDDAPAAIAAMRQCERAVLGRFGVAVADEDGRWSDIPEDAAT